MDWLALTAIATAAMAVTTVWLGWQTRQVATAASRSSAAAERHRREDLTRERAMELLKRVVQGDAVLRDLIRDLEADTKVNAQISAGMMLMPPSAWPHFEERWAAIAPELTTHLYVAEFVEERTRQTVRERMESLTMLHERGDDDASITAATRSLLDALDPVRGSIDRALGLAATHRRL